MKLYLDTSTPETIFKLDDKEYRENFDRDLAEKLIKFIHDKLAENNKSFNDLLKSLLCPDPVPLPVLESAQLSLIPLLQN